MRQPSRHYSVHDDDTLSFYGLTDTRPQKAKRRKSRERWSERDFERTRRPRYRPSEPARFLDFDLELDFESDD